MAYPSKKEQIISLATVVFMVNGFSAKSMEEIITATQVSRRTMYKHFPSKKSLIAATIERYCQEYERTLEESLSAISKPSMKLAAFCEHAADWYRNDLLQGCLASQAINEFTGSDDEITRVCTDFKKREIKLIKRLLLDAGFSDVEKISCDLFIVLEGYSVVVNKPQICQVDSMLGLIDRVLASYRTEAV